MNNPNIAYLNRISELQFSPPHLRGKIEKTLTLAEAKKLYFIKEVIKDPDTSEENMRRALLEEILLTAKRNGYSKNEALLITEYYESGGDEGLYKKLKLTKPILTQG